MKTLPDKPSELIRLALRDLKKCESDPRFKIDMAKWYCPRGVGDTCLVCLAGSVMAQWELEKREWTPSSLRWGNIITKETERKLWAINAFISGDVSCGLYYMRIGRPNIENVDITLYPCNPEQFHIDMENLAATFENEGL